MNNQSQRKSIISNLSNSSMPPIHDDEKYKMFILPNRYVDLDKGDFNTNASTAPSNSSTSDIVNQPYPVSETITVRLYRHTLTVFIFTHRSTISLQNLSALIVSLTSRCLLTLLCSPRIEKTSVTCKLIYIKLMPATILLNLKNFVRVRLLSEIYIFLPQKQVLLLLCLNWDIRLYGFKMS